MGNICVQVIFAQFLRNFAKTLERYRKGILAYYKFPISTGPLEGTNNKIKTINEVLEQQNGRRMDLGIVNFLN